jgi:hypothetical protein
MNRKKRRRKSKERKENGPEAAVEASDTLAAIHARVGAAGRHVFITATSALTSRTNANTNTQQQNQRGLKNRTTSKKEKDQRQTDQRAGLVPEAATQVPPLRQRLA